MKRTETVDICKRHRIPDPVALARYESNPAFGPKVLFFSGGSALHRFTKLLIRYTHNSTHLITPFDSGGSSAEIRKQFKMLAVGDIRHRLMALAEPGLKGNPEVFRLFAVRLDPTLSQEALIDQLKLMIEGRDPLVRAIADPLRKIIRNHLNFFFKKMPASFSLKGASIGNLVLTGGYLNNRRQIDPVIYLFSRLIEARGTVRPITTQDLQLRAEFEDHETVVGQHLITGKESAPIEKKIVNLCLARSSGELANKPKIKRKVARLIEAAELICYPIGSFFSSLTANFLVQGVGDQVVKNQCPKVYIPNLGDDPEQYGYNLLDKVNLLIEMLRDSSSSPGEDADYLNFVLIDDDASQTLTPTEVSGLALRGITVINTELVDPENPDWIEPQHLINALLSLI